MNAAFLFLGKTFAASVMIFLFIVVFQVIAYGYPARDIAVVISGGFGLLYTTYKAVTSKFKI